MQNSGQHPQDPQQTVSHVKHHNRAREARPRQSYCYPLLLTVLLIVGLTCLFVLDKKEAYVGTLILSLLLLLFVCSVCRCWYPNTFYYAPVMAAPWFYYEPAPIIIDDDVGEGWGDGDGGGF